MSRSAQAFLPKNKRLAGMAIGAFAMLAMAMPAMTQEAPNKDEVFTLTTTLAVPVSGQGASTFFSFDISWVDPVLQKYFLADRNNKAIDVVDPNNLAAGVKQFVNSQYAGFTGNNDTSGPDGVLTVNNSELWVGDSNTCATPPCDGSTPSKTPGEGRVWVLDAQSGAILPPSPIGVGGHTRADELCFDPVDHLIMIASPAEDPPYVTFISTTNRKVVTQLKFDGSNGTPIATGGLEQCGWSPRTGKFYQNVPVIGTNSTGGLQPGGVAVIDPKSVLAGSAKVEKTLPVDLDACGLPQGMAIGPHNQIMLGCNGPSPNGHRNTAIINIHSGATVAVFPDLGGADEVWFNEGDGHFIIPGCNTDCRTATTPQKGAELVGIIDSKGHRLDTSVVIADKTTALSSGGQRRIHSAAADPNTNQIFVPIPAAGGAAPTWDPTICSQGKQVGSPPPSDKTGCIAVFATTNDDRSRVAEERGADDRQQ
jgi:hypothetical protein